MRRAAPGLSLALLAAERGAWLCTIMYYLVTGHLGWFGLTIACMVPGYVAQLLSILWFRADGHQPSCWLLTLHLLQLGLCKRYRGVSWLVAKTSSGAHGEEMLVQYGDACVLRLLEALLQTLPHLLLQTYVIVAVDPAGFIPGVSAGLSLLSLAWALVSYSCFTCLLRPGHLFPPATAILCLLLWRVGMLGTRVLALVLFARLYSCWVFAVAGAHWLFMSFWLVAQQTDIVAQPCRWRLFNCLVGAVYVFCYVNVGPGPSKNRVAVFYAVMLTENTLLLLLATRFLQTELSYSLCVTGAIMSGSVIGAAALGVYYSLLHPKSTEIWQGFLETACSAAAAGGEEAAEESSQAGQSEESSGDRESLAGEGTTADPKGGDGSSLLQVTGCPEDGWTNHHHWLLLKLALKTGDLSAVNAACGDGGVGQVSPAGWAMGRLTSVEPEANLAVPTRETHPRGVESGLTNGKLIVVGNGGGGNPSPSPTGTSREDGVGQDRTFHPAASFAHDFSLDPASGSSTYFTASAGGTISPRMGTTTPMYTALMTRDGESQSPPGCLRGGGGDLSLGMVSISPIPSACAHKHLQSSWEDPDPSREDSESVGPEGALMEWHHLQDTLPCGAQGTAIRSKLRSPRFTSTPKADPKYPQQGLEVLGEGPDPAGVLR